jgi:hypothetical protein
MNKLSTISEGVTEIRISSQPCKGINLTTQAQWNAWFNNDEWRRYEIEDWNYMTLRLSEKDLNYLNLVLMWGLWR